MDEQLLTARQATTRHILNHVAHERDNQDEKWGRQRHRYTDWLAILTEEVGESAKDALTVVIREAADESTASALHSLRMELIQTAAVAIAIVEQIDEQLDALEDSDR